MATTCAMSATTLNPASPNLVYEIWHNGEAYYALEGWRGCDFEEGTEWIKASG